MRRGLTAILAVSILTLPAMAGPGNWDGEGSLTAALNTGNTETSDLGIGVKMARETQIWRISTEFIADYGTKNGSRTKNRYFASGQFDRTLDDNLFGFARVSHEENEFSGFNSRSFVASGLGWLVLDDEAAKWSLEGGPGVKFDRLRSRIEVVEDGEDILVPARSDESYSMMASSRFAYTLNDHVRLSNDTNLIYADVSTQFSNKTSLTASLTQSLSARFSIEVRHDSAPPEGFVDTDTSTRMSLVYSFGS
ncbi:MAG: YdiY family protein [Hyphomonas sp.]